MIRHAGIVLCKLIWPWPDPRSRSRGSKVQKVAENCTFVGLCPLPFWRVALNWWLVMIVRDIVYSLSEHDFQISLYESYHVCSNFAECRYYTNFKWPYFRTTGGYGDMIGHASTPTVYALRILIWPWPDPRSRSRWLTFWNSANCTFLRLPSSAILAWHSQLMGDYDSMGCSLHLFRGRFLNSPPPRWQSCDFGVCEMFMSPESTAFYLHSGWG